MDNNVGKITLSTEVDTKGVDKGLGDIERKVTGKGFMNKFTRMFSGIFSKVSSGANKITSSIGKGLTSILKGLGSIISSVTSIGVLIGAISLVGIIGMIALAVGKSEEARAKIEQIANMIMNLIDMLAQALLPLAKAIVDVIYKIFLVIGSILKEWFGIDLFAQKTNDSLNKGVKSAKALRKQLMGFDEMNILNSETGSTGIGASGGSTTADLGFKVDTKSLKEAYQKVKNWFLDLPIPINLDYVGDAIKNSKLYMTTLWGEIKKHIFNGGTLFGGITGAIFGEGSIEQIGADIVQFITHPITTIANWGSTLGSKLYYWIFGGDEQEVEADYTNIMNNIDNLSDNMKRLLHLPDDFNTDNLVDEFMNATTEINGDIVSVKTKSGKVIKLTKKQYTDLMESIIGKSQYGSKKQQKDMNDVENKSTTTTDNIKNNWFNTFNDIIRKYPEVAQAILDGNYEIKKDYVEVKTKSGEIVRYSIDEFKKLQNKLTDVGDEGKNSADTTKKNWFSSITDIINKFTGKDSNSFLGAVTGAFNDIPDSAEDNTNDALNSITNLIKKFKPPSITGITLEPSSNGLQTKVNNLLKKVFGSIGINFNFTIGATSVSGGKHGAKGLIFNPPKLARGGIINRPGRGVNYRSAIIGERGREAVVPLTDSQQMSLLGQEIAKNVVINLTNVTELDGRVIARSVNQVMNDMNFASNGGAL